MRLLIVIAAGAMLASPAAAGDMQCMTGCSQQQADSDDKPERSSKRDARRTRQDSNRDRSSTGCRRDPMTQACSLGASPFASF
ncbi:hypothetical protein [Sphingomicrobium arenosum]|uniref:hypothetical protein n=1 Tax=Sphingomicrobium arenosum TaxID=2233861 RepID=UPI00223F5576|nr:hypothetical protein [Sphingomicrobium arenosum]